MSKKHKRKLKVRAQGSPATHSAGDQAAPDSVRAAAAKRAAIEHAARELFIAEGGGALEQAIRVGELTSDCYEVQMLAARDGGDAWGPEITPSHDRMNRGLQLRLIKERNKWLEDCRQRIADDYAQADEPEMPEDETPEPTTEPIEHGFSAPTQPAIESEAQPAVAAGSP